MTPRLIVVLGMHRSGTSVMARAMMVFGAELGTDLLPPVAGENSLGFWEDREIVEFNDRLLFCIGRNWDSVSPIDPATWQQVAASSWGDEAHRLIKRKLASSGALAIKDPRMMRMLPFWLPILEHFATPRLVLGVRNPLSVAQSLAVRNGFDRSRTGLLWLGHQMDALAELRGRDFLVVDFDRLVKQPERELERISRHLGLPIDVSVAGRMHEFSRDFLSPNLKHSEYTSADLARDPEMGALVRDVFEFLLQLSRADGNLSEFAWHERFEQLYVRYSDLEPALKHIDSSERMLSGQVATPVCERQLIPAPVSRILPVQNPKGLRAGSLKELSVSVVIPLFNHADYIESTISSALEQSRPPIEIIVVDDGSTDDSLERVRALAEKFPSVIFWSQPNQGAHQALNAGVLRATGDVVAILNSDDVYDFHRLGACIDFLARNHNVSLVATNVQFIDEAGNHIDSEWHRHAWDSYVHAEDKALALIQANAIVSTSNFVVRRSVFSEIGLFAPLRYTHDLDFLVRMMTKGREVSVLDQPLLKYRRHSGNTVGESDARVDIEIAAIVAMHFAALAANVDQSNLEAWRTSWVSFLVERGLTDLTLHLLASPPKNYPAPSPVLVPGDASALSGMLPEDWCNLQASNLPEEWRSIISARHKVLSRTKSIQDGSTKMLIETDWWNENAKAREWLKLQNTRLLAEIEAIQEELAQTRNWVDIQAHAHSEEVTRLRRIFEETDHWQSTQIASLEAALQKAISDFDSAQHEAGTNFIALQEQIAMSNQLEQRLGAIYSSPAGKILSKLHLIEPSAT